MQKKKILFIMPSMFIGGAERSLLGLLDTFDYDKYDVSLFLYRHEGEFLQYIPDEVNIIAPVKEYATFDVPIKSLLKSSLWKYGCARLGGKVRLKLKSKKENYGVWASMQNISRSLLPLLPDIQGQYDVAISFLGIPDVLLKKVTAKIKIAWNHTDYTILGPDKDYDRKIYKQIDYIVSVSDQCTAQFIKEYPEFAEKAVTIQNIISKRLLKQQALESINDMVKADDGTILLSIGRFSDAKNFDNIPDICRIIRQQGCDVKWYLIGYGGEEHLIRQRIRETAMEDYVIILGKRENPYPYIKACDIYVQPSRYEGKCVSVLEAQILNKPVIITNYATSGSQLQNGIDGIVVPMDNKDCAKGIVEALQSKELQDGLMENTRNYDYTNIVEIEKLYQIMEAL